MYDERSGFPVHTAHSVFVVEVQLVLAHDPMPHALHLLHVATENCTVLTEKVFDGHCFGTLDPLGQYVPAPHAMGISAGLGQM